MLLRTGHTASAQSLFPFPVDHARKFKCCSWLCRQLNVSAQHRLRKQPRLFLVTAAHSLTTVSVSQKGPCPRCKGTQGEPCQSCSGLGKLPRGGYHKRNPVNMKRIVGSKWTAMERTLGWRHFRVLETRKEAAQQYVLLSATCDEETKLWVNAKTLKERDQWASGWLQKKDLQDLEQLGGECKRCAGTGMVPCALCGAVDGVIAL